MNKNCAKSTVKVLRQSDSYRALPRGSRLDANSPTKSRCNKSQLCKLLKIVGSGTQCHLRKAQMKNTQAFRTLPENHIAKTRKAKKTQICNAISQPFILEMLLHSSIDHNGALGHSTMPDNMVSVCGTDHDIASRRTSFSSKQTFFNIINNVADNTIATLIIITHGAPDRIITGQYGEHIHTNQIGVLAGMLRPKLMHGANIFLVSCQTGYVDDRSSSREIQYYNNRTDITCFANTLARALPGTLVFGTQNNDQQNSWAIRRTSTCGSDQAVPVPFDAHVAENTLNVFQFS